MNKIVEGRGYINGEWLALSGASFVSQNPASGVDHWHGAEASVEEVEGAFEAAHTSFGSWRRTSSTTRSELVLSFASALEGSLAEELAQAIVLDAGKTLWEARQEVAATKNKAAVSIEAMQSRAARSQRPLGGGYSVTAFDPLGVIAVLGPYNFPVHLSNGHIIPALLAGNTIVLKPSPLVPYAAEVYGKIWQEVGLPAGVLNVVHGGAMTAQNMIDHDAIAGVCFTGSRKAGIAIHKRLAGRPEVMLALEMGGNSPLVIWSYNDIEAAVFLTIQSAFITSGQRCSCARRLIVNEALAEEFLGLLCRTAKNLRIGAPDDEEQPYLGPLITRHAVDRVLETQTALEEKGAKVLLRAEKPEELNEGFFVTPAIVDTTGLDDVTDEEVFGPLLKVQRVKSFAEACRVADATDFGLAAGLVSTNKREFDAFAAAVTCGVINWNQQTTGASGAAPFGGLKQSGNHQPAGYFAVDYVNDPVAYIEKPQIEMPAALPPGFNNY